MLLICYQTKNNARTTKGHAAHRRKQLNLYFLVARNEPNEKAEQDIRSKKIIRHRSNLSVKNDYFLMEKPVFAYKVKNWPQNEIEAKLKWNAVCRIIYFKKCVAKKIWGRQKNCGRAGEKRRRVGQKVSKLCKNLCKSYPQKWELLHSFYTFY